MYIDVVDLVGIHLGIFQRIVHHQLRTQSVRMGGGEVMGISRHAATRNLCIDGGTPCDGMLQLFQDECCSSFSHHKPVAAGAEGT